MGLAETTDAAGHGTVSIAWREFPTWGMWHRECSIDGDWEFFGWTGWDVRRDVGRSRGRTEDAIASRRRSKGTDERKIVRYMDDATGEVDAVCLVTCLNGAYMVTDGGEGYVVACAGVWFCESVH